MNVQIRKLNFVWSGVVILSFALIFSGCLKSIDQTPPEKKAYISLMHLAPKAPALEVYVSGTKSSTAIAAGSFSSAYSAVTPGIFDISFKKASSDSVVASIGAAIYDSLKYYTLVVYNDQPNSAKALRITDDFSNIGGASAYYRFFHMSAEIPAVDLYINNSKVQTDREFADIALSPAYNSFSAYAPGSYSVQVKKAGTDSVIAQTSATLFQSNAFTIFLDGLVNNGGVSSTIKLDVLQATSY
jgi:Domain of unknown function (DUF4397)